MTLVICAATASLFMAGAAAAQDVTFNIGVTSDYVFRGVSQTDNEGQIYGGADATLYGIGYAGV